MIHNCIYYEKVAFRKKIKLFIFIFYTLCYNKALILLPTAPHNMSFVRRLSAWKTVSYMSV